jgi:hypothetical protein
VWEAISAVATAVAAVVAAVAYAASVWSARRSQASRVAAWLEPVSVVAEQDWWAIRVLNNSDQPVYDVEVTSLRVERDPLRLDILPPGRLHEEPASSEMAVYYQRYNTELLIAFTDGANRRWHRRAGSGRLARDR